MPNKQNILMKNMKRMMLFQNNSGLGLVHDMNLNRSVVVPMGYDDEADDDGDDDFFDEEE